MKERVYVGLSGGVDSAVSASLLKQDGYDVVGVFIRIWRPTFLECTWKEDRLDAMRVAAHLGIPFKEVDLSDVYEKEVIGSMLADYARGITPNPDVLCNEKVKFGAFQKWALADGATFVATGHYARRETRSGAEYLLRGIDPTKDQSYFLYRIGQDELRHTLFPVGGFRKTEIRALAKQFNLPVAAKPDSQGLCFVGDISMPEFLRRYMHVSPGDILDTEGGRIGRHDGAALYTRGQRHGLYVEGVQADRPHYVVDVDTVRNVLVVSSDRANTRSHEAVLDSPHWIGGVPDPAARISAVVRYHAAPVHASIGLNDATISVHFDEAQLIAPGQAIVLYEGDTCLGGGVARDR